MARHTAYTKDHEKLNRFTLFFKSLNYTLIISILNLIALIYLCTK